MPSIRKIETGADIEALRKALGISQPEMASRMGLSARAYFTLEQEPQSVNMRHIRLAEYVALQAAVEAKDRSFAPDNIARTADAFAKLPKKA